MFLGLWGGLLEVQSFWEALCPQPVRALLQVEER